LRRSLATPEIRRIADNRRLTVRRVVHWRDPRRSAHRGALSPMRRTVLVLSLSALALTGCHRSSSGAKSVRPLGFVGFETRLELSLPAAPVAALAVVDFDSDGRCDLAAVDRDGNLAFAMGVGGGAFAAGHSHRLHRGPVALEV